MLDKLRSLSTESLLKFKNDHWNSLDPDVKQELSMLYVDAVKKALINEGKNETQAKIASFLKALEENFGPVGNIAVVISNDMVQQKHFEVSFAFEGLNNSSKVFEIIKIPDEKSKIPSIDEINEDEFEHIAYKVVENARRMDRRI